MDTSLYLSFWGCHDPLLKNKPPAPYSTERLQWFRQRLRVVASQGATHRGAFFQAESTSRSPPRPGSQASASAARGPAARRSHAWPELPGRADHHPAPSQALFCSSGGSHVALRGSEPTMSNQILQESKLRTSLGGDEGSVPTREETEH